MAAPAVQVRVTPAGRKLERGGPGCLICFGLDPDVSIWEIDPGLPGLDTGEAINISTQWNYWEMKAAQLVKMLTDTTTVCAFDPDAYNNIITNLLGKNGQITVYMFDGSTISFWGYLKSFIPTGQVKENMPTANVVAVATNRDSSGAEQGPVIVAVAGT